MWIEERPGNERGFSSNTVQSFCGRNYQWHFCFNEMRLFFTGFDRKKSDYCKKQDPKLDGFEI